MYAVPINTLATVNVLGRMTQRCGWEHNGKRHGDHLLVAVVGGACTFYCETLKHEMSAGDALLIPAGTSYKAHTDVECDYYFFHFRTDAPIVRDKGPELSPWSLPSADKASPSFNIRERPQAQSGIVYVQAKTRLDNQYREVLFLISKCFDKLSSLGRYDTPFIRLYFTEILLVLSQQFKQQSGEAYPLPLKKMIMYVNQNYTLPLSLQDLSEHFQLSKQYISRLFAAHLRVSANHYILTVKLYHAQELLKFSSMNVAEISDYLGFCSPSYFTRVFKQMYAITPKRYQAPGFIS
ncbi:MAG: AraC family transcriptional regulator [Paenibacillaceae bacterium]|jgi:AraC-like DNA-binding protein|nr:AraC family transcriptional regulator [Paenibacillaceae bacterium]